MKPAEIVCKETIAALIYGQPGMGKTTLACSAPDAVLFDFDGGVTRLRPEHQVDVVQISSWEGAQGALKELEGNTEYKTVVVDTLSKMIDCIITSICGTSQPQIKQWGLVNAKFKNFIRGVNALGMNVVFVAQRTQEKDGEIERQVPDVRQSNYKDIVCDMDVIGYMEMVTVRDKVMRRITFNPTPRNEGKNTADFEPYYDLPELEQGERTTFLADRMEEYVQRQRQRMEKRREDAKKSDSIMKDFEKRMKGVDDAMSLNEIVAWCKTQPVVSDVKLRMRELVLQKAKALNVTMNKDTKLYE